MYLLVRRLIVSAAVLAALEGIVTMCASLYSKPGYVLSPLVRSLCHRCSSSDSYSRAWHVANKVF